MMVAVQANLVARIGHLADHLWELVRHIAQNKEGGFDTRLGQDVQKPMGAFFYPIFITVPNARSLSTAS